jgi:hypothetical protein
MIDSPREKPDLPDYELLKTPAELPSEDPSRRRRTLWMLGALFAAAVVVAAYMSFRDRQASRDVTLATERVEAGQRPAQPLGGTALPVDLPPLDQTDQLVRELMKQLSSHPRVAAWLATDGLIRSFVAAVANVADGQTPATHLRILRPSSGFVAIERDGNLFVDPRSFDRYDTLAAAAASIDAAGAASVYSTLKPRIEEAYRELGFPDTPFDRTLQRAVVLLLATPHLDEAGRLRVESRGIGYGFADPTLEALPAAQKQLLRTGPRNGRSILASLRNIALALGIPAEQLPAP